MSLVSCDRLPNAALDNIFMAEFLIALWTGVETVYVSTMKSSQGIAGHAIRRTRFDKYTLVGMMAVN